MNSLALAETISIDFDDQRATCVKNLQAGNIEQINLDLKDVSRVRIRAEEHGHHFRLYLESVSSESLQVGIAIGSYLPEALIAHGKKIGKILNKPVVLQHTNLGNLISEEVLQA